MLHSLSHRHHKHRKRCGLVGTFGLAVAAGAPCISKLRLVISSVERNSDLRLGHTP
jgi:hypothetical protein